MESLNYRAVFHRARTVTEVDWGMELLEQIHDSVFWETLARYGLVHYAEII
jgi:dihydroneopterin aldolase|tara:strand:- start:450 stop:602 length:153 start_codon:yes stop_codon:yes gene_type:complete